LGAGEDALDGGLAHVRVRVREEVCEPCRDPAVPFGRKLHQHLHPGPPHLRHAAPLTPRRRAGGGQRGARRPAGGGPR